MLESDREYDMFDSSEPEGGGLRERIETLLDGSVDWNDLGNGDESGAEDIDGGLIPGLGPLAACMRTIINLGTGAVDLAESIIRDKIREARYGKREKKEPMDEDDDASVPPGVIF